MEGQSVDLREGGQRLGEWADIDKVRKVYKLETSGGPKKTATENTTEANEKKRLEGVILGIMTVKGS